MKMRRCIQASTLTVLLLLACTVNSGWADIIGSPAKLHASAPLFTLQDQTGKNVALSDFIGKYVVIEFMSTDCLYVKRHHCAKTTQKLFEKYKAKNVAWIAVNSNRVSDAGRNRAWAAKYELSYPILDDSNLSLGKAYNVTKTPTYFIVDRSGNIVYTGAIDDDDTRVERPKEGVRNYIDRALGELVSGTPVSIPETKPYGCDLNKPE